MSRAILAFALVAAVAAAGVAGGRPGLASSGDTFTLLPCGGASCDQQPSGVEVAYPLSSPPAAIQITWDAGVRPSHAPSPSATTAVLMTAEASSKQAGCQPAGSGQAAACWAWPSSLEDGGSVLNGTYAATPCSLYGSSGCEAAGPAVTLSVAAPPGPPRDVTASGGTSGVEVGWAPPAAAPPDLAAYEVKRDNAVVYSCWLPAAGSSGTACPSDLRVVDHPPAGSHTYAVIAERLGASASSAAYVASAPAPAPAPVVVAAASRSAAVPVVGGSGSLPPLRSSGTRAKAPATSASLPETTVGRSEASTAPTAPPESGTGGTVSDPAYQAQPTGGLADAVGTAEPGPRPDLVPQATIALGLLILAIAAHVVYLRVRVTVAQSRRGGPT